MSRRTDESALLKTVSTTGGYQPRQPSQMYPWTANQPPRVDNINQPWYGGPRLSQSADTYQDSDVVLQNDNGSPVQNMSDVWGQFNSFYGGETAKANLTDPGSVTGMAAVAPAATPSPPASVSRQSFFASLAAFFNSLSGQNQSPSAAVSPGADQSSGGM
jgi:hypothetical protein